MMRGIDRVESKINNIMENCILVKTDHNDLFIIE
jgi:hypothetical protein